MSWGHLNELARADEWIVSCEWMLFNSLSFARYARTRFNNNKPTHYKHTARTNTHLCTRTHLSTAIEKIKQVHLCKHWCVSSECELSFKSTGKGVAISVCFHHKKTHTHSYSAHTCMCVWRKLNRRIDNAGPFALITSSSV